MYSSKIFICLLLVLQILNSVLGASIIRQKRIIDCTCVPVNFCKDDNGYIGKARKSEGYERYDECDMGTICCLDDDDVVNSDLDRSSDSNQNLSLFKTFGIQSINFESTSKPALVEKNQFNCGQQLHTRKSFRPRIISGDIVNSGKLPWNLIVEKVKEIKQPNLYLCGASLIHPKVAITAAHCVERFAMNPNGIAVRAGIINARDSGKHPAQLVQRVVIHDDYFPLNSNSPKNDIALLFLYNSFNLSSSINTICLPSPNLRITEDRCIVSGFGITSQKEHGSYSNFLRMLEVSIVKRSKCEKIIRSMGYGANLKLDESFICAGGVKNQDSCIGDGGNPLICPLKNKDVWVQVGIVSFGFETECGLAGIPGGYTNALYFRKWIEKEFENENLSIQFFTYSK